MKTRFLHPSFFRPAFGTPGRAYLKKGLVCSLADLSFSLNSWLGKNRSFEPRVGKPITKRPASLKLLKKTRALKFFSSKVEARAPLLLTWLILSLPLMAGPPQLKNPVSSEGKIASPADRISPQAKIPLAQAVQEALAKDPLRRTLALEADRFSLEARQIARQKLFSVAAFGNYLYKSQTVFLELPTGPSLTSALSGAPSFQRIEAGLNHNYDFGLSISQPIFTGGRLTNSEAISEAGQLIASTEAALLTNELAATVKALYFQYQRLQARKNYLLALSHQLSLHEKKTASLVEAQLARRLNLVETRMKREELEVNLLDLEQAISSTRISFQYLCGHFPEEVEDGCSEPELTWEEALAIFEQNHPQFKIFEARLTQLELQKKVARASNLPQVAGVVETHYGKPGINFFKREWSFYAQAGLSFQFRLFDWQQTRAEIEILSLEEQKVSLNRDDFTRKTRQELARLFEQKKLLAQKIQHLENIISLAEEEVKLKEQLVQGNLLPHLDYLTSLSAREQNEWARAEALLALEEIKVKINGLIGWSQPEDK